MTSRDRFWQENPADLILIVLKAVIFVYHPPLVGTIKQLVAMAMAVGRKHWEPVLILITLMAQPAVPLLWAGTYIVTAPIVHSPIPPPAMVFVQIQSARLTLTV